MGGKILKSTDVIKQFPHLKIHLDEVNAANEDIWLEARKTGVGGSDVGPICGISKWSCPLEIYLAKTGQELEEDLSDFKKSIFHFGHVLEAVVADEYTLRTNTKLAECKATFKSAAEPWKLANVDRLILDDDDNVVGIFEAKTTTEYNDKEWKEGSIPLYYLAQLNWYLHVFDLTYGVIACLVGGNKYYYYEVIRNDEWLNEVILPTVDTFWNTHVSKLQEPPIGDSEADLALLNKLYPPENAKEQVLELLGEGIEEVTSEYIRLKQHIKELDKIKVGLENAIKKRMTDNTEAITANATIKWKPQKQTRLDSARLKVEHPQLFKEYAKEISFKKFSVKFDEGED